MNVLKKNIIANYIGNFWQAIMGLVFVPLYIKFMGIEAFGLVGFFIALQAMFAILDMGLGQTLNRELASLSAKPGKEQEMRNIVRTLEFIYWGVAIIIGIIVVLLAPIISHYWISSTTFDSNTVEQVVLIMGITMTIQWPISLYSSGLRGLQELVILNSINIVFSTLKGAGAVFVLWLIAPTIQAFFLWQIIITICYVLILKISLWSKLPKTGKKSKFQKQLLYGIWKFTMGVSGITILSAISAQADKIILSKLLPLEMFGYYSLATTIALSLNRFIFPISGGIYPRITQLVSSGDYNKLKQLYHKSCQLLSVVLFPITFFVAGFSYEIIFLWTQNTVTTEKTYIIASIFIIGTALNGLVNIPNKLQFAYGWTKLGFKVNLFSIILYIPFVIYMTNTFGVIGASISWVILSGTSLVFIIHIMHSKILSTEKWNWYIKDVSIPLITSLFIIVLSRLLIGTQISQPLMIIILGFVFLTTLMLSALATTATRTWMINAYLNRFKK